MEYRITICRLFDGHYIHFLTTSQPTYVRCKHVYKVLVEKFPSPEYKITITEWQSRGVELNLTDF